MTEMIYKATAKAEYGLTDSMFKRLGKPDKLVKNPNYKSGPPAALYLRSRVEEFCRSNAVAIKDAKAKRRKRSESAMSVAAQREMELTAQACALLQLTDLPDSYSDIVNRAEWHLTERGSHRDVTDRDIVNTLRHECSNYDEVLAACSGKPGAGRDVYSPRSNISYALHEKIGEMIEIAVRDKYGIDLLPG